MLEEVVTITGGFPTRAASAGLANTKTTAQSEPEAKDLRKLFFITRSVNAVGSGDVNRKTSAIPKNIKDFG